MHDSGASRRGIAELRFGECEGHILGVIARLDRATQYSRDVRD
jgi:hypothetical protein